MKVWCRASVAETALITQDIEASLPSTQTVP